MRVPTLPPTVALSNIASAHADVVALKATPDGKRMASAMFRLINLQSTTGNRVNGIGKGIGAVLLNAISDIDGFNPWQIAINDLTQSLIRVVVTQPDKYRELALIGLSHPDSEQAASFYTMIKAHGGFDAAQLDKLTEEAHARKSKLRDVGMSDQDMLDTIAAQHDRRHGIKRDADGHITSISAQAPKDSVIRVPASEVRELLKAAKKGN